MKKLIALISVALVAIVGCKTLPTPDSMYITAKSVGIAAGYAIELLKIEDNDKAKLFEVMNTVKVVIPVEGSTYKDTWKKLAETEVEKLVKDKKIKKAVGEIIVTAVATAGKGVDRVINKYPEVKENSEVVKAAINGVFDGIEAVLKPVSSATKSGFASEVNYEAYFIFSRSL